MMAERRGKRHCFEEEERKGKDAWKEGRASEGGRVG